MSSPHANFDSLAVTTLENYSASFADNVSNHSPALMRMKKKGGVVTVDGGTSLVEPLDYAENSTFQWYTGYETLDVSPSDVLSAAEYTIKQGNVNVIFNGLEEIQNSGKSAMKSLIKSRIKNAERTARNQMSTGFFSDGTGSGGKQIGGLDHLISLTPTTGTVGSINAATWSFWQNYALAAISDGTLTNANIVSYFNRMVINTTRDTDKPDMILAGNTIYRLYLEHIQGRQYIVNKELADAGFSNVPFDGIDVVLCGGVGGALGDKYAYFVNTDFLKLKVFKGRNWNMKANASPINQDATIKPLFWAGNLTCSNRQLQGVLQEDAA